MRGGLPYDALFMGSGFEQGQYSRKNMVITIDQLRHAEKHPSTWFRPQLEGYEGEATTTGIHSRPLPRAIPGLPMTPAAARPWAGGKLAGKPGGGTNGRRPGCGWKAAARKVNLIPGKGTERTSRAMGWTKEYTWRRASHRCGVSR